MSDSVVAAGTLSKISTGAKFTQPLVLTAPQLDQFGKNLVKIAGTNPERASKLLQRTLDLVKQGAVKLDCGESQLIAQSSLAKMSATVVAAIQKADPSVATPAPAPVMR
jgi:hypothetical protein